MVKKWETDAEGIYIFINLFLYVDCPFFDSTLCDFPSYLGGSLKWKHPL